MAQATGRREAETPERYLSPELACVDGADGVEKLKCCSCEATSGDSATLRSSTKAN
jgi:hypothetical protein